MKPAISIFCIPATGHLNPVVAAAKELTDRGCDVVFYTAPAYKETAEKSGASVRVVSTPYDGIAAEISKGPGRKFSATACVLMQYAEVMLEKTFEEIKNNPPGLIVHDAITLNAKAVCRILGIPSAVIVPVFAFEERKIPFIPMRMGGSIFKMLASMRGLPGFYKAASGISSKYGIKMKDLIWVFNDYGDVNIVTTSEKFQYDPERFSKDRFKFTGPLFFEKREQPADFRVDKNKKTILVSLGTVYNDNKLFYEACLEAFSGTDYNVVMAVKDKTFRRKAQNAGNNFYVRDYVPQLEILGYADVFVTHAGMNSVNEALYNNVPLVCVPQAMDQFLNAERVRELGAGLVLKKISSKKIRNAVETVLSAPEFKNKASEIGKTLKTSGGVKRAADEILKGWRQ